jgi:predicted O-methyltransferase YrrM
MSYTRNWNQEFVNNTNQIKLKNQKLCLEIGSFEGLTSNYIVDNILSDDGKLICIDPLTDTYLVENLSENDIEHNNNGWKYFNGQYDRFIENTKNNLESKKIELYRELSSEALPKLKEKYKDKFDFIYIDGDHRDFAVYFDAVNSFEICKPNGYILFDDYLWEDYSNHKITKDGIDRFINEYSDKLDVVINAYQVMIRKK